MESRSPTIWKNDGDDSFCENLKELLLFTSESLSFCEIPHYFIRKINLVENLPGCGQLPAVAKYIYKIINEDGFPRKHFFDSTVFHLMAFNPAEFQVISRGRNPKYLCYDNNSFIMETCV